VCMCSRWTLLRFCCARTRVGCVCVLGACVLCACMLCVRMRVCKCLLVARGSWLEGRHTHDPTLVQLRALCLSAPASQLEYDRNARSLTVYDDRGGEGNAFELCGAGPLTTNLPVGKQPLYFFMDTCTHGQGATLIERASVPASAARDLQPLAFVEGDALEVLSGPRTGQVGKLVERLRGRPRPLKLGPSSYLKRDGTISQATGVQQADEARPPDQSNHLAMLLLLGNETRATRLQSLREELVLQQGRVRQFISSPDSSRRPSQLLSPPSAARNEKSNTRGAGGDAGLAQAQHELELTKLTDKMASKAAAVEVAKAELDAMTATLREDKARAGAAEETIAEKEQEAISIKADFDLKLQAAKAAAIIAAAAAGPHEKIDSKDFVLLMRGARSMVAELLNTLGLKVVLESAISWKEKREDQPVRGLIQMKGKGPPPPPASTDALIKACEDGLDVFALLSPGIDACSPGRVEACSSYELMKFVHNSTVGEAPRDSSHPRIAAKLFDFVINISIYSEVNKGLEALRQASARAMDELDDLIASKPAAAQQRTEETIATLTRQLNEASVELELMGIERELRVAQAELRVAASEGAGPETEETLSKLTHTLLQCSKGRVEVVLVEEAMEELLPELNEVCHVSIDL
jgi:hypothetical protein